MAKNRPKTFSCVFFMTRRKPGSAMRVRHLGTWNLKRKNKTSKNLQKSLQMSCYLVTLGEIHSFYCCSVLRFCYAFCSRLALKGLICGYAWFDQSEKNGIHTNTTYRGLFWLQMNCDWANNSHLWFITIFVGFKSIKNIAKKIKK